MDWDSFKYLIAAAGSGSVRGAARALGVHASTVTRRLDALEAELGVRLFTRTRDGLEPTAEGRAVVQALDRLAGELAAIEQRLKGSERQMAGPVRVAYSEVLPVELIAAPLAALCREHAALSVELICSWQLPNLDRREAELVLAVTDLPPEHLIGRRLGVLALAAYAAGGAGAPAAEPAGWLGSRLERELAPGYQEELLPGRPVRGYCDTLAAQLAAVTAGLGATLLPRHIVTPELGLQRVAVAPPAPVALWLLSHPDSRRTARVQAAADAIGGAFRESAARLGGKP